jgi:hypothetical protein
MGFFLPRDFFLFAGEFFLGTRSSHELFHHSVRNGDHPSESFQQKARLSSFELATPLEVCHLFDLPDSSQNLRFGVAPRRSPGVTTF